MGKVRVNTYLRLGIPPLFILEFVIPQGIIRSCSLSMKGRFSYPPRVGVYPSTSDHGCRDATVIGRYGCRVWGPALACSFWLVLRRYFMGLGRVGP